MTCVVGYIDKEDNWRVYIGADSAGVGEHNELVRHNDPKVVSNGPFLIGFTTSWRMGNLLAYALNGNVLREKWRSEFGGIAKRDDLFPRDLVHRFMCTDFVDAVRTTFKENGYTWKDHEREQGGEFLVGYKGYLYTVDSEYGVTDLEDGYGAVGDGARHALGALFALRHEEMPPKERVMAGLSAAEWFTTSVRSPYRVYSVDPEGVTTEC